MVALVRQSHTKHLHTLCEENVRILNVKSGVHVLPTLYCRIIQKLEVHSQITQLFLLY
jgi:hypothetical protein